MELRLQILILLASLLSPFNGTAQITFENSQKELINIGKIGTINAFVREISSDSLFVGFYH